jgi:hypothetical protein
MPVDYQPDLILNSLHGTSIFFGQRKPRWGKGDLASWGGFLYLNGQAGVNGTGLVLRVGTGLQEFLGQTFLSYRIIDSPRGYLDQIGGFRFTYLGDQVDVNPNVPAIDAASTALVNDFAGAVHNRLVARLQPELAALVSDVKTFIQDTVVDRLNSIRGSLPSVPVPPVAEGAADKIRDNLQAFLDSEAQELAATIRASVEAKVSTVKAELTARVNQFHVLPWQPDLGDQFEQKDHRVIGGLVLDHKTLSDWFGRAVINDFGLQIRDDYVFDIALNHTDNLNVYEKQQMRWIDRGAHLLLEVRTRFLNENWRSTLSH